MKDDHKCAAAEGHSSRGVAARHGRRGGSHHALGGEGRDGARGRKED